MKERQSPGGTWLSQRKLIKREMSIERLFSGDHDNTLPFYLTQKARDREREREHVGMRKAESSTSINDKHRVDPKPTRKESMK